MNLKKYLFFALLLIAFNAFSQTGTIRGNVFDKNTGEPIMFGSVSIDGSTLGTTTDLEGFFSLSNIPAGKQTVVVSFVGYEELKKEYTVRDGSIETVQLFLETGAIQLKEIDVSGRREQARTETQVSKVTITPKQVKSMPSIGGQADLAQYLPVLPGVIFSGDQGGQLYIRGGSPVQNMVLLDGMVIYNPFHSIGFYSVFETEAIRNIDVYTGGFGAEYGGRASAVLDIKTREGNRKRLAGQVSATPFVGKVMLEGPLSKLKEDGNGGSISYMLTAKHSYIDQVSKSLYAYAVDTALYNRGVRDESQRVAPGDIGLPFSFTDIYGKLSFLTGNGTKFNLFGFNHDDRVRYPGVDVNWDAFGAGTDFTIVPANSSAIIGGLISFSDYEISLDELEEAPRRSRINGFNFGLDFSYFGNDSEIKYGFQIRGMRTELEFRNFSGITIDHTKNTTEVAGFFKYRKKFNKLVIEPSLRLHFYASLNEVSPEPRLSLKYNVNNRLRLKAAGGLYSQNLIATVREDDVVALFVGFITDPEETFFKPGSDERVDHKLQKAVHGIFGAEIDITNRLEANIEPYFKRFTQIVNLNRNKNLPLDPDYATETGDAYGVDFSLKYQDRHYYLWAAYSLAWVKRFDGEQEYPPIFDRRHNLNLLGTYTFGSDLNWEASVRWNFGTGFPFTLTQGFFGRLNFTNGLDTDPRTENPPIDQILSEDRNSGRLPAYSRIDLSMKYTHVMGDNLRLESTFSITNVTNRENIFFADPKTQSRINQLPILPSLGLTLSF
jgi:hypothetical protein